MRKKELRGSSGQVNGRLFSYCEGRGFSRARPRCVDIEQVDLFGIDRSLYRI